MLKTFFSESKIDRVAKLNIIFLDIDGVIYKSSANDEHFKRIQRGEIKLIKNDPQITLRINADILSTLNPLDISASLDFNRKAIENLITLCEETNAVIVISSNWRIRNNLKQLKALFSFTNLDKYIIDITPQLKDSSRSEEIATWLFNHFQEINSFVIFDDIDEDLSKRFNTQFIHCFHLISDDQYCQKAKSILMNPIKHHQFEFSKDSKVETEVVSQKSINQKDIEETQNKQFEKDIPGASLINHLAKSMSITMASKHIDPSIKEENQSKENSNQTSLDEAYTRLKGALTKEELQQLSFIDDLLSLPEIKRNNLIANIQKQRPGNEDNEYDIDFGSGKAVTNYFLDGLCELLSKGISLTQFASLNSKDQHGFTSQQELILLFMRNGIAFERLAEIHIGGFYEILKHLNDVKNFGRISLLYQEGNSPAKQVVIEQINTIIDDIIFGSKNSYTFQ